MSTKNFEKVSGGTSSILLRYTGHHHDIRVWRRRRGELFHLQQKHLSPPISSSPLYIYAGSKPVTFSVVFPVK